MKSKPDLLVSRNPADGTLIWSGSASSEMEIDGAVRRARDALPEWSSIPVDERVAILERFARILNERKLELARTIALEVGKPLPESEGEVAAMAGKVAISIRAHEERCAEFTGGPAVTRFRPHGVVAVFGPFNFPGHLPNGHIVPALLAGNTVIFKPSELAPATAEATLACWKEAGLPAGVLNLVHGAGPTGSVLSRHPGIDGIFFTGSAHTGQILARQAADRPGLILALEMGGNNPLIVDTGHLRDRNAAVQICLQSAFITSGQRCTCARRLILINSGPEEVDAFLNSLVEEAAALTIDDPLAQPPPFMGPLASDDFPARILDAQTKLLSLGARPLLEARHLKPDTGFLSPGIVDVTGIPDLPDEEVFGPFLQVQRVSDLDAAIAAANNTRFGLAAGMLSDSEERYRHAWPRLRAGIINWNAPLTGASSAAPFGGIKQSGNHRPAAWFAADFCSYPVASIEKSECRTD